MSGYSIILACLLLFVTYTGCTGVQHSAMNTESPAISLARKIVNREFGEFFVYPMHDQTIDRIWENPEHHQILNTILDDTSISSEARFLAAEVLFQKDLFFTRQHSPAMVAAIYADALSNNRTGMANSWGLLYEHQDDGPVGITFLNMGKEAISALSALLDDERDHLEYQGSEEATIGNQYRYRVKDFAAYYIGRILGKPLKYYPDFADRDAQIEELKRELAGGR